MTTWIQLHGNVFENRKVVLAAKDLTRGDREKVVGHLARLWSWAMDHAQDGDLSHLSASDIAGKAGWRGRPDDFVRVLKRVRLIDRDMRIHDWDEYAGTLNDRRRRDRERKRLERAAARAADGLSEGRPLDGPRDVRTHRTGPDSTEPDPSEPDPAKGYGGSRGALKHELRQPAARSEGPAAAVEARRYNPPARQRDGRLIDGSGREWDSMDQWAGWVREHKEASSR